jgi:hypothetical protein
MLAERDYRDLALADLALELVDREREIGAYRELLQMALAQLHGQHREIARLHERHARLLDESRGFRERVMRTSEAA